MLHHRTAHGVWLLALLCLASPPALAQGAAGRTGVLGDGPAAAGARLLSRDELRKCLQRQQTLAARQTDLQRHAQTLKDEQAALVASGAALQAELQALDNRSEAAVNAFNAKAAQRDAALADWTRRQAGAADDLKTWQQDQQAWAQDCAGRRYREEDRAAVERSS